MMTGLSKGRSVIPDFFGCAGDRGADLADDPRNEATSLAVWIISAEMSEDGRYYVIATVGGTESRKTKLAPRPTSDPYWDEMMTFDPLPGPDHRCFLFFFLF